MRKILRGLWIVAFVCVLLVPGVGDKAWGATVNLEQARLLAENWLAATTPPIRQGALGRRLKESIPCLEDGRPLFYVFNLAPQGWLIVGGDTRQEPIMAFGEGKLSAEVLEDKAFMALFSVPLSKEARQEVSSVLRLSADQDVPMSRRGEKWRRLLERPRAIEKMRTLSDSTGKPDIPDIRVQPLVRSLWNGKGWGTKGTGFDRFFAKHVPDIIWNDGAGIPCAAVSAAQLMHYFRHPNHNRRTDRLFTYYNHHEPEKKGASALLWGDADGAPYRWEDMTERPRFEYKDLPDLNVSGDKGEAARRASEAISRLMMDVVVASGYGMNPRKNKEGLLGGFDSTSGFVDFVGLQMSMTSLDVFDYSNMALFETTIDSSHSNVAYDMKDLHSVVNPNLDCGVPVIVGIRPLKGLSDHAMLVDGYGIASSDVGLNEMYHHIVMGSVGGDLDMYYPMDNFKTELLGGPAYFTNTFFPIAMLYNIASEDLGSGAGKRSEIVSGRLSFAGKPYADVTVSAETSRGTFSVRTNANGIFAFRLPSVTSINQVSIERAGLERASVNEILEKATEIKQPWNFVGTSETKFYNKLPEPQVGNRWWGDIVLEQALVSGVTDTMKKGVSRFNVPMPSAFPKQASAWDFRGLSAVYVSAFPFSHIAFQSWFGPYFDKLAEFVKNGGTAYIEADSWLVAAVIARRAGIGLSFYNASELPLYYGGDSKTIFPKGDLRAAVGKDWLKIPYKPYEIGSGGPLIKTLNGTKLLSTVEVTLFDGKDAYTRIYPAAVSFPYGRGMVYFTSFPVPDVPLSASASLRGDVRSPSAERALADWFLSKPIANAERMSAMRSAGISNERIVDRADGPVSRAKGSGLLVELPASEDVTVAAQMSRLGMKGAGAVSEDAAVRRWTASLLAPDGRVHDVRTTSGDVLSFSVVSGDNDGGAWLVRLDSASGYPEGNLFVVTAALGLKDVGGTPGSGDVPPDVPVTGLRVEPDSADLKVGERLVLRAVLSPPNATDKRVSWSVSNPSVASADASGNILALAEGTTFVRATAADGVHSADCTVRVARAAVLPTALALTPQSLLLTVGESAALAVSFIPPETTERDVTWSTSNPAVASAEDGQVRAVGVGTAQITAVSAADAGVRAVCSVTVRKKNGGGGTPEELAYYRGRYPDHNVMIASEGDSELLGTDGPDVLVGGSGDNWLEGKGGNDIYVQNLGGGHDTISNRSGGANDVDELHFGPGIVPETLFPYRKGGDLVFSLPDERGEESASTTVEDWYEDAGARLDRIVFMDGTVWTAEDAEKRAGNPPVALKGGSGADRMKTRSRKKDTVVLYGLEGDDRLKDGKGDDVFVGGPGDDFIHSWSLLGGKSRKTFIWNRGDGDDTVDFYFFGQKSGQRRGILRLGLGIAPGEVSLERRGGGVRVVLPGGSVTFRKAHWFTGFHHPDAIVFADGTAWQWRDIPQK